MKKKAIQKLEINEKRCGIDRRVMSYDGYIPERRVTVDRRLTATLHLQSTGPFIIKECSYGR